MNRLLYRYIAKEILVPFILGLAAFNGILFVGRLLNLASLMVASQIPIWTMLQMLAHLLPTFCLITIPMSFFLAVLLAFGRLSSDSEITAMKASGISLTQLLPPVIGIAALSATLTLLITLYILPNSSRSFKGLLREAIQQGASMAIRERVFNDQIAGVVLYCSQYNNQQHTMRGILIQDERNAKEPLTIFASTGSVTPDPDGSAMVVALTGGSIHGLKGTADYRLISFDRYTMTIPIAQRGGPGHDEQDMTISELVSNLQAGQGSTKLQRDMQIELHKRLSFPVACFIFAFIGMALGIQNQRTGKGSGFTVSLIVFVAYFVVFSIGKNLGQKGVLHPGIGIWLPNVLFLAFGMLLFRQTAQESRLAILCIRPRWSGRRKKNQDSNHAPH
jgi:lipopolysaccharide export system permease protein